MDKLDQLIAKFKEVKEELAKNAPLHSTVEGFMGGLKALPKGSPERGKFITAHMSHPGFISALNAHPQGKQLHGMLMGHLDSKANAGPKGPMKVSVGGASVTSPASPAPMMPVKKSVEDELEDFEKAYISPYFKHGPSKPKAAPSIIAEDKTRAAAMGAPSNPEAPKHVAKDEDEKDEEEVEKALGSKSMTGRMLGGGATGLTNPNSMGRANMLHDALSGAYQPPAPKPVAPAPGAPAKKLTGLDRIRAEGAKPLMRSETEEKDFKSKEFGKTINSSYAPQANGMAMSRDEKLTLNKGGQWSLDKALPADKIPGHTETAPGESVGPVKVQTPKMKAIHARQGEIAQQYDKARSKARANTPMSQPTPKAAHDRIKAKYIANIQGIGQMNKGGQWSLDTTEPLAKDVGTMAAPAIAAPKFANMRGGAHDVAGAGATYGKGGYQITQPVPALRSKTPIAAPPSTTVPTKASTPASLAVANTHPSPGPNEQTQVPLDGFTPTGVHNAPPPTASYEDDKTNPGLPPHLQPVSKDENSLHCSRCKKKPCSCIKTDGVLVDKAEKC